MRLSDKQALFFCCLVDLGVWARRQKDDNGHPLYRMRMGDGYRDPRAFGEHGVKKGYASKHSNHKLRLACDVILDVWNGSRWVYARSTDAYRPLGEHWKTLHDFAEWGGEEGRSDGNHFSFRHQGRW